MKYILFFLFMVSLLLSTNLQASYTALEWGDVPLTLTPLLDPSFVSDPSILPRRGVQITGLLRADFFRERILASDNPMALYNHYTHVFPGEISLSYRPAAELVLKTSFKTFKEFYYLASHEFPEDSTLKTGNDSLSSKGGVYETIFSLSGEFLDRINAGLSGGLITGNRSITSETVFYPPMTNTLFSEIKYNYSGIRISAGAGIRVSKLFSLNQYIGLPYSVKRKTDLTAGLINYPVVLSTRITLHSSAPSPMRFYVEGTYENSASFSIQEPEGSATVIPTGFRDTFSFLTGFSSSLTYGKITIPFKLGYFYRPDPEDLFIDTHGMFTGVSLQTENNIDVFLMGWLNMKNYRGDSIFYDSNKLIHETLIRIDAGLVFRTE